MKRVHRTKGFTFIEFMLVVAILGILAGVAVPAFLDYVEQNKQMEQQELFPASYAGKTYLEYDYDPATDTCLLISRDNISPIECTPAVLDAIKRDQGVRPERPK